MAAVQAIKEPLRIFVGYDSREHVAWEVCRSSILKHASVPVTIERLDMRKLRHAGLYRRHWRLEEGQQIDAADGRPFSTEFAFPRFLVPALMQWRGVALFCDCDFLWRADVAELFALHDPTMAVQVVKHDHKPPEAFKMEGQSQGHYHRKNWSSLVLWNCGHAENLLLTPDSVNTQPGQWLHAFDWLPVTALGALPINWNALDGVCGGLEPKAVHFTSGGPWHAGHEACAYAAEWRAEADRIGFGHTIFYHPV